MSNIKVAVRIRPRTEKETRRDAKIIVDVDDNVVQIHNPKLERQIEGTPDSRERTKTFTFDYAYESVDHKSPVYATQEMIYQDLGTDVLQASFDGFNACLFAYGQTGSGKTYTMMGQQPKEIGLIPRICENLFSQIEDACEWVEDEQRVSFKVSVSYLEIYNERVRDLLRPPSSSKETEKHTLKVREHPKEGPFVDGLVTHPVKDNKAVQALINRGNDLRTTAETHFHDRSSRSHAIFTITFTQAKYDETAQLPSEKVSKINLVDLAGSERADPHQNYNKGRLKEGANINKSLVTLGNVIQALAERSLLEWSQKESGSMLDLTEISYSDSLNTSAISNGSSGNGSGADKKRSRLYIPYRDSVLTWLLKDSLGGNSKTIMVATVSPSHLYYAETISTLRYAQRAKSIVNKPVVNEDGNVTMIRDLKEEVNRLKVLLAAKWAGSMSNVSDTSSMIAGRMEDFEVRAKELTDKWLVERWHETQEIMKDPQLKMSIKRVLSGRSNSLPGDTKSENMCATIPSMETDMSINPVRLGKRSNSMGVIVDSHLPHLLCMDDDILSTGIVMYHLKEGKTNVGTEEAEKELDIYIQGDDAKVDHCVFKHVNGTVVLHAKPGAFIKVNDQLITHPYKLSQGDIIFLGRNNMFRFNNPMEAAKLRETRKAQFGDGRLPGALSRWSSQGSVSTQASLGSSQDLYSPASSLPSSLPSSPMLKKGVEMERSEEDDKIAKARQEIEKLQDEQARAEEVQFEKEEEMWRIHEGHKLELEAEKEALRRRIQEFEEEKAEAELEIEDKRRQLMEDSIQEEERLEAERAALSDKERKHWAGISTKTLGFSVETMSDIGGLALRTESQMKLAAAPKSGDGEESQKLEEWRLKLEEREEKLSKTKEDLEKDLSKRQQEIEEMFLADSEKLELDRRRIKDKEKDYQNQDAAILNSFATQTDHIEQLEYKKVQLVQYIEAKEFELETGHHLDVDYPVLGSSVSDDILSTAAKPVLHHPNSHHHTRKLSEPSYQSGRPPPAKTLRTAGISPLPSKPVVFHGGSLKDSSGMMVASGGGGARPKTRASTVKEVTSRLYNPEKIKKQVASRGIKQREAPSIAKSKSTPAFGNKNASSSPPAKSALLKQGNVKQHLHKRLQQTSSMTSLASVPETLDEMDVDDSLDEGQHHSREDVTKTGNDAIRFRNNKKKKLSRPHSWAAPDAIQPTVALKVELRDPLPEGSMEYDEIDKISLEGSDSGIAPSSNGRKSSSDGLMLDLDSVGSIDPLKEARQSPDGKEHSDSIISCNSSVIPMDIPDLQVGVVVDNKSSCSSTASSQQGEIHSNTFHNNQPLTSDFQVKDFMQPLSIDTTNAGILPSSSLSSKSQNNLKSPAGKSNSTKKSSKDPKVSSPAATKKRPKSASSSPRDIMSRIEQLARPRSGSTRSYDEQPSPKPLKKQRASSDKGISNVGSSKRSSRTPSLGTPSPQPSPRLRGKSNKVSPQPSPKLKGKPSSASSPGASKKSSKSKVIDSNNLKSPKAKRPLEDSQNIQGDKARETKKPKSSNQNIHDGNKNQICEREQRGIALGAEASNFEDNYFNFETDSVEENQNVFRDSKNGVKKKSSKKRTPDDLSFMTTEELQSSYLDSIQDILDAEDNGRYSDDSLDEIMLGPSEYEAILNSELSSKSVKDTTNKEPSKKKQKLATADSTPLSQKDNSVNSTSNAGDDYVQDDSNSCQSGVANKDIEFIMATVDTTSENVDEGEPVTISGHNVEGTETSTTLFSMPPSINLPQAILQANTEPDPLSISLPYYFRASLSDTELNTKRLSDASDFGGVAVSVLKGEKERPKSASATYRDGTLYGRQGSTSQGQSLSSTGGYHAQAGALTTTADQPTKMDSIGVQSVDPRLRKSSKHRSRFRPQDEPTESESGGQMTDDSLHSGTKSKSNGRPSPGTIRRRKLKPKTPETERRMVGLSSEEYVTSDDSRHSYSEDSMHSEERCEVPELPELPMDQVRDVTNQVDSMTSALSYAVEPIDENVFIGNQAIAGGACVNNSITNSVSGEIQNNKDSRDSGSVQEHGTESVLRNEDSNMIMESKLEDNLPEISDINSNKHRSESAEIDDQLAEVLQLVKAKTLADNKGRDDINEVITAEGVIVKSNAERIADMPLISSSSLIEEGRQQNTDNSAVSSAVKSRESMGPPTGGNESGSGQGGGNGGKDNHEDDASIFKTAELEQSLYTLGTSDEPADERETMKNDQESGNIVDTISQKDEEGINEKVNEEPDSLCMDGDEDESHSEYLDSLQEESPPLLSIREFVHNISVPPSTSENRRMKLKRMMLTKIQTWDNFRSLVSASPTETFSYFQDHDPSELLQNISSDQNQSSVSPSSNISSTPSSSSQSHEEGNGQQRIHDRYEISSLIGPEAVRPGFLISPTDKLRLEFEVIPARSISRDFQIATLQHLNAVENSANVNKDGENSKKPDSIKPRQLKDSSGESEYSFVVEFRAPEPIVDLTPEENSSQMSSGSNITEYEQEQINNSPQHKVDFEIPYETLENSEISIEPDSLCHETSVATNCSQDITMDTDSIDMSSSYIDSELGSSHEPSPERIINKRYRRPMSTDSLNVTTDEDRVEITKGYYASDPELVASNDPNGLLDDSVLTEKLKRVNFNEDLQMISDKSLTSSSISSLGDKLSSESDGVLSPSDIIVSQASSNDHDGSPILKEQTLDLKQVEAESNTLAYVIESTSGSNQKTISVDGSHQNKNDGNTSGNKRDSGYYGISRDSSSGFHYASDGRSISASESESESFDQSGNYCRSSSGVSSFRDSTGLSIGGMSPQQEFFPSGPGSPVYSSGQDDGGIVDDITTLDRDGENKMKKLPSKDDNDDNNDTEKVKPTESESELTRLNNEVEREAMKKKVALPKPLSMVVLQDENEAVDNLNEQEKELIMNQEISGEKEDEGNTADVLENLPFEVSLNEDIKNDSVNPSKPLRRNYSMVVETGNGDDDVDNITEEDIELLKQTQGNDEMTDEEQVFTVKEPEDAVPPDANVKILKKNPSMTVFPDLDREENELTEEDIELMKNSSDYEQSLEGEDEKLEEILEENVDDITKEDIELLKHSQKNDEMNDEEQVCAVKEPENAGPPDANVKILKTNPSMTVFPDLDREENELLTEEGIELMKNPSDYEGEEMKKKVALPKQQSMVVPLDENEAVDNLNEQEIELIRNQEISGEKEDEGNTADVLENLPFEVSLNEDIKNDSVNPAKPLRRNYSMVVETGNGDDDVDDITEEDIELLKQTQGNDEMTDEEQVFTVKEPEDAVPPDANMKILKKNPSMTVFPDLDREENELTEEDIELMKNSSDYEQSLEGEDEKLEEILEENVDDITKEDIELLKQPQTNDEMNDEEQVCTVKEPENAVPPDANVKILKTNPSMTVFPDLDREENELLTEEGIELMKNPSDYEGEEMKKKVALPKQQSMVVPLDENEAVDNLNEQEIELIRNQEISGEKEDEGNTADVLENLPFEVSLNEDIKNDSVNPAKPLRRNYSMVVETGNGDDDVDDITEEDIELLKQTQENYEINNEEQVFTVKEPEDAVPPDANVKILKKNPSMTVFPDLDREENELTEEDIEFMKNASDYEQSLEGEDEKLEEILEENVDIKEDIELLNRPRENDEMNDEEKVFTVKEPEDAVPPDANVKILKKNPSMTVFPDLDREENELTEEDIEFMKNASDYEQCLESEDEKLEEILEENIDIKEDSGDSMHKGIIVTESEQDLNENIPADYFNEDIIEKDIHEEKPLNADIMTPIGRKRTPDHINIETQEENQYNPINNANNTNEQTSDLSKLSEEIDNIEDLTYKIDSNNIGLVEASGNVDLVEKTQANGISNDLKKSSPLEQMPTLDINNLNGAIELADKILGYVIDSNNQTDTIHGSIASEYSDPEHSIIANSDTDNRNNKLRHDSVEKDPEIVLSQQGSNTELSDINSVSDSDANVVIIKPPSDQTNTGDNNTEVCEIGKDPKNANNKLIEGIRNDNTHVNSGGNELRSTSEVDICINTAQGEITSEFDSLNNRITIQENEIGINSNLVDYGVKLDRNNLTSPENRGLHGSDINLSSNILPNSNIIIQGSNDTDVKLGSIEDSNSINTNLDNNVKHLGIISDDNLGIDNSYNNKDKLQQQEIIISDSVVDKSCELLDTKVGIKSANDKNKNKNFISNQEEVTSTDKLKDTCVVSEEVEEHVSINPSVVKNNGVLNGNISNLNVEQIECVNNNREDNKSDSINTRDPIQGQSILDVHAGNYDSVNGGNNNIVGLLGNKENLEINEIVVDTEEYNEDITDSHDQALQNRTSSRKDLKNVGFDDGNEEGKESYETLNSSIDNDRSIQDVSAIDDLGLNDSSSSAVTLEGTMESDIVNGNDLPCDSDDEANNKQQGSVKPVKQGVGQDGSSDNVQVVPNDSVGDVNGNQSSSDDRVVPVVNPVLPARPTQNGQHRDTSPPGAVGGAQGPRLPRHPPDQYTDGALNISVESYDEGYTTMMGSPRSEMDDHRHNNNLMSDHLTASHEQLSDHQHHPPTNTSTPRAVPPLDLSSLSGQSEDSTPRLEMNRQRSSERGELQGDSRFVEVMDTNEPKPDANETESTRFIALLDNSQSSIPDTSLPHDDDNTHTMDDYVEQLDTPPESPTPSPRGRILSENDITIGELSYQIGQQKTGGASSSTSSLRKSDLHLQPARDVDRDLFESKEDDLGNGHGGIDNGSYELVHSKSPEPKSKKRKRKTKKSEKANQLTQSDMTSLTNEDIDNLEEKLQEEGTEYTTIRDSNLVIDPSPSESDLNRLSDEVEGKTVEGNRNKKMRKNMSMVVEVGNDEDRDDITEEEIERELQRRPEGIEEDQSPDQVVLVNETDNAVPPKVETGKKMRKNLSMVVNPDLDRSENELTEEDIALLREQSSSVDLTYLNEEGENNVPSVIATADDDELQDQISEDEIEWSRMSENEDNDVETDRSNTLYLDEPQKNQKKGSNMVTNPSMVANFGDEEQENITEEEIEWSRKISENEEVFDQNNDHSEGDDEKVHFLVGDEQEQDGESENEKIPASTSEERLSRLIQMMSKERDSLREGGEETQGLPSVGELKTQLNNHKSRSHTAGQSDSAFSSDYTTDHTQSDFTDSETAMISPKVLKLHDLPRGQDTMVGSVIHEEPGERQSGKTNPGQAFKDSGSICETTARTDSDGEDENTKVVGLQQSGKADSIEEIQLIPKPIIKNRNLRNEKKGSKVEFADTSVVGFDVKPCEMRPVSPDSGPLDGHDLIQGTFQTVTYSKDRTKARLYSDIEVLGVQPGGLSAPQYIPGPEHVLRDDEPQYANENNLTHAELNIEINPRLRTPFERKLHYSDDDSDEEMKAIEYGKPENPNIMLHHGLKYGDEVVETEQIFLESPEEQQISSVRPKSAGAKERTPHSSTVKSKSEPGVNKSAVNGDQSNMLHRQSRSPVRRGLSETQRRIGQMTDSEREMFGSKEELYEDLMPSFPDMTGVPENDYNTSQLSSEDKANRLKSRSMDAAVCMSSTDPQVSIVDEEFDSSTDEENDAIERVAKMNMFKRAGMLRFQPSERLNQDFELRDDVNEDDRVSLSAMSESSDICGVQMVNSEPEDNNMDTAQSDDEDKIIYNNHAATSSASDLSPGELRVQPMSLDTLASLSSEVLDSDEFDQMKWIEEVANLPEKIAEDMDDLRESWMRRYHNWHMNSLSMSELEYIDSRDLYDGMSLSVDCIQLLNPTFRRVASSDSITYVFMDRARSLDGMVHDDDEREGRLPFSTSEPSCLEKELRHKFGIDESVLPFTDKSHSAEALSESGNISQEGMSSRQRSRSLDNSKLLNGEIRPDSPEINEYNIFGGVGLDIDDESVVSHKPPRSPDPDSVMVRPIAGEELVRLRTRRSGKEINKRVSWGDVEEKLTYSSGESSRENSQPPPDVGGKFDVAVQTSSSIEDLMKEGAKIIIIKENETQTSDQSLSLTDAEINLRPDQSTSFISVSSQLTDAQTSPIPFERASSSMSREVSLDPPGSDISESASLIQEALEKLRSAMGSQTDISIVDPSEKPFNVGQSKTTQEFRISEEMVYPPTEGPISISSPKENEQQHYPRTDDAKSKKPKAARELLRSSEHFSNERFMTVDDFNSPGMDNGRRMLTLKDPDVGDLTIQETSSNKPPQPVGRARPMQGYPGYHTQNTEQAKEDSLPQFINYSQNSYQSYPNEFQHQHQFMPRLPSEYPRTIETQTWPDVRVIETQTINENRMIETQTSPLHFNDTDSTQTEIVPTTPIYVQTDDIGPYDYLDHSYNHSLAKNVIEREMVNTSETGCNPSPPRGFSPIELAAQTDLSMFGTFNDGFCQTDDIAESINVDAMLFANVQQELLRAVSVESIGIQAGSPRTRSPVYEILESDVPKTKDADQISEQSKPVRDVKLLDIPVVPAPQYQFYDPSLLSLKDEHAKLMKLFSNSKDSREEGIKNRLRLREQRRGEVLDEMERISTSLNSSFAQDQSENTSIYEVSNQEGDSGLVSEVEDQLTPPANQDNNSINNDVVLMGSVKTIHTVQGNLSSDDSQMKQDLLTSQGIPAVNEQDANRINVEDTEDDEDDLLEEYGQVDVEDEGSSSNNVDSRNDRENTAHLAQVLEKLEDLIRPNLVMSDEFSFTIQEGSNPDITDMSNNEGNAEDLKGNAVDIIAGGNDSVDEILLVAGGRSGGYTSPVHYEKIADTSGGYEAFARVVSGASRSPRLGDMNASIVSSTGAEIQEIMASSDRSFAKSPSDKKVGSANNDETSNEPPVKIHKTSSEKTESNDADMLHASASLQERPPSCVVSTQYEEGDFAQITNPSVNIQVNADSNTVVTNEDTQSSDQVGARSRTSPAATVTKMEDSDIRSIMDKYQTIKKLVEEDNKNTKSSATAQDLIEPSPCSQKTASSGGSTEYGELPNATGGNNNRKRSHSAGSSAKRDHTLDESLDISLTESYTGSEMKDEACETDHFDYSDELERLRRERRRILDMLAKDMMPSKLQVELAEAQLNYIIGQTDTLLHTIDEPIDWDLASLSQYSTYPEEQLGEISKEYLSRYRTSLEESKQHIDIKIRELETDKERKHRARERSKKFARLRREAAKEVFVIERLREENAYQQVIKPMKSPRSHSDSPLRRSEPKTKQESPGTPILSPSQRQQYLTRMRKGLVKYTDDERSRSISPALSTTSSTTSRSRPDLPNAVRGPGDAYSPYRSTYLEQYGPQAVVSYPRTRAAAHHMSGSAHHPPGAGAYSMYGDSDTMSIGSLDEDTQRLLGDVQQVRGQTSQEIEKARKVLERRTPSIAATPSRPSSVYSSSSSSYLRYTPHDMYGIVSSAQLAADIDRRAQDRIDRIEKGSNKSYSSSTPKNKSSSAISTDKQIDNEIEELKKKYGMMSRDNTTSTLSSTPHTASALHRYTRSTNLMSYSGSTGNLVTSPHSRPLRAYTLPYSTGLSSASSSSLFSSTTPSAFRLANSSYSSSKK